MSGPRYPLDALAAALRIELHRTGRHDGETLDAGLVALADRLGIRERWARRLLATGLTDRQADHFATRTGRHPASVWPDWWEHAGDDAEWYSDDPALECLRPGRRAVGTFAPYLQSMIG